MKTSNKILLGGFLTTIILLFAGMIIAKNNMIFSERNFIDGSGNPQSVQLLDTFTSKVINIDASYYYVTLDANLKGIAVMADDNLIDHIKISDKNGIKIYRASNVAINPKASMAITIGTMNKKDLIINMEHNTRLNTIGEIKTNLEINVEDRVEIEVNVSNESLVLNAKDKARVKLTGTTQKLNLNIEDGVMINALEIAATSADLQMENDARLITNKIETINGTLKDYAHLIINEKWKSGDITKQDHAIIDITKNN